MQTLRPRLLALLLFVCTATFAQEKSWMLGPFQKLDAVNPILRAKTTTTFFDPVSRQTVRWEAKDVYNPATVVRGGKLYMLYRAEDTVARVAGTSRLGLAVSTDGVRFTRLAKPVFYPANDRMKTYEWPGGCEDPRVAEAPDGRYVLTYTAYDGDKARLCVATSRDLRRWTKHGLAFDTAHNGRYRNGWSKSGSIVCKRVGSRFVAQKIGGKYWMYWGDQPQLYVATSPDLIHWTPVERSEGNLMAVANARPGKHDTRLLEPGPPAFLTKNGIVLIYNGMNDAKNGDATLAEGAYAGGQLLFDAADPTKLLDRSEQPFLKPDKPYEITGQVNHVCFLEGLAWFRGRWWLYYGTADSKIAVATAE